MADEPQVEEVKEDQAKVESKGANPWIPVILVVILVPALSFVVTDMVLIPKMKKSLETALGAATFDASHSDPSSNGGSSGAGTGAESGEVMHTFQFKNVLANLIGSMQSRYIKVSFIVEGRHAEFNEIMTANEAKLIDATLSILSSLSVVDLEQKGIRDIIRSDLLAAYATVLKQDIVNDLYFSEFVVQ